MSRYNSVVLSFGDGELDEVDHPELGEWTRDCEPIRQVNAWLKEQGYEDPLEDIGGGWLLRNACLFGGCYNKLCSSEFSEMVQRIEWRNIEHVRILFWDEEDETFTLIPFPLDTPKRSRGRARNPG